MKYYIFVFVALVVVKLYSCKVTEGVNKSSESKASAKNSQELKLPNLKDCKDRINHLQFQGHGYFFSWEHEETQNLTVNWLTGRNICRRHCMDLISLETPDEIQLLKNRLIQGQQRFTWTSGRKCNFDGCDREDLKPSLINGWFWPPTGVKILPNEEGTRPTGPWSATGGDGKPQPDNREFRVTGRNDEACLAMLNNFYGDGVVWHDIACYHKKPFVCEDNDSLIKFIEQSNPGVKL